MAQNAVKWLTPERTRILKQLAEKWGGKCLAGEPIGLCEDPQHLIKTKRKDYIAIQLEVYPSNMKALDFYSKNGFHQTESNLLRYSLN